MRRLQDAFPTFAPWQPRMSGVVVSRCVFSTQPGRRIADHLNGGFRVANGRLGVLVSSGRCSVTVYRIRFKFIDAGLLDKSVSGHHSDTLYAMERIALVDYVLRHHGNTDAQIWIYPCMTGHLGALRLMSSLAGGTGVASGIAKRSAVGLVCAAS